MNTQTEIHIHSQTELECRLDCRTDDIQKDGDTEATTHETDFEFVSSSGFAVP